MRRRGRVVAVLAALLGAGSLAWAIPATAGGIPLSAPVGSIGARARPHLGLTYTPPVLVRAGEPVSVPVDAACLTVGGTECSATVTVAARAGAAGWSRASAAAGAFLRFDLTAPAARALEGGAASGSVAFTVSARAGGAAAVALGTEATPLRFYVTRRMPVVSVPAVPFGHAAAGRTTLYLPWGSGPEAAGVAIGNESLTLGPSSFTVDRGGLTYVLDGLQQRLAVFRGSSLVRAVGVGRVSPDADVALAPMGEAFVSSSDGGSDQRAVAVRRVTRGASGIDSSQLIGHGIPAQLDAGTGVPRVRLLPEDEWRSAPSGQSSLTVGRLLPGGAELLSVVRGGSVRLGTVVRGSVRDAVELRFGTDLGELALAAPFGSNGYVVVVHVASDHPAADQYQAVVVRDGRVVSTFAIARADYARSAPLSRFRLGPDGALYQLASSSDGVRVVRFDLGGVA